MTSAATALVSPLDAPPGYKPGPGRVRPTLALMPLGFAAGGRKYTFPFFIKDVEGLQKIIDYSLNLFATRHLKLSGSNAAALRRGRLILTGHSGGGAPLSAVLNHMVHAGPGGKRARRYNPDEVHVFDGLYGGEGAVLNWAVERAKGDLAALPPTLIL